MRLPFTLETALERTICADPVWQAGAIWGQPRPGHAEGAVMYHIADVLANITREATSPDERRALRLIALIHDNLKYRVDQTRPKVGANHHAAIARRFAERYIADAALLDIIELHDEAYLSWRMGALHGEWERAEQRAERLLARLGPHWPLYLRFFRADNATASKDHAPVAWFEGILRQRGYTLPPTVGATDPGALPASG